MAYISYLHFLIKNRETNILNQINLRNELIKDGNNKDVSDFCDLYNIELEELKKNDISIKLFVYIINDISLFQLYQKNKYKRFMIKDNKVNFSRYRQTFFKNKKVKFIWKEYYTKYFFQKGGSSNFLNSINRLINQ